MYRYINMDRYGELVLTVIAGFPRKFFFTGKDPAGLLDETENRPR